MNEGPVDEPSFVVVGRITRSHGTSGELFVHSLTDHPEATFVPGVILRIGDLASEVPDEFFPPLHVTGSRPHKGGYLVQFDGVGRREQSDLLRERDLLRPFEEVAPPAEDEIFQHELRGMSVVTVDGRELGRVKEVFEVEPAHLLEVGDAEQEYLIPFSRQVIVRVDRDTRRLTVDPPEGLLDL
ncbi:MAG: ribosome maturation factor RimM [Gemmatimonadota bacterium]